MADSKVAARLQTARKDAGYENASDAARAFGWSVQTYLAHENGSRGLARAAKAYAKAFKVSVGWLLNGEVAHDDDLPLGVTRGPGPEHKVARRGKADPRQLALDLPPLIDEIDVRAGAGLGGDAQLEAFTDADGNGKARDVVIGQWLLPPDYLATELRVDPRHVRIIPVVGDSMQPTLESGDRVMINLGDQRPSPGGIFALWDGLGVVLKRIEHIPNTDPPRLRISSDNPKHATYERTIEEVRIIGRAAWKGSRL